MAHSAQEDLGKRTPADGLSNLIGENISGQESPE